MPCLLATLACLHTNTTFLIIESVKSIMSVDDIA